MAAIPWVRMLRAALPSALSVCPQVRHRLALAVLAGFEAAGVARDAGPSCRHQVRCETGVPTIAPGGPAQGNSLSGLSVADAGANEASGSIGFRVTLDPAANGTVTVVCNPAEVDHRIRLKWITESG